MHNITKIFKFYIMTSTWATVRHFKLQFPWRIVHF